MKGTLGDFAEHVSRVTKLLEGRELVLAFDGGKPKLSNTHLLAIIVYVRGRPVPLKPFVFNEKPDAKALGEAIHTTLNIYSVKFTDVKIHLTDRDATNKKAHEIMNSLHSWL